MSDHETPGGVIARLREARGMTRYRLAMTARVDATQLGRIESGEAQPTLPTALRIFRALAAGEAWAALLLADDA